MAYQPYPTTYELYDKYKEYNVKYFNGILPPAHKVTIEWSSSLSAVAGKCYYKYVLDKNGVFLAKNGKRARVFDQVIRLSTQYHELFPQESFKTLLHEMIHLLVGGHGPNFAYWIERIRAEGGDVARHCNNWKELEPKWLYECQTCGMTWKRRNRFKTSNNEREFVCPAPCRGTVIESKISEKS